ncbi:MAG: response regulator [Pseudomonadota bacterium]|nr:response regulator [Pseudomonadota bacterium]
MENNRRILAVDDDQGIRDAYRQILTSPVLADDVLLSSASLFGGSELLKSEGLVQGYELTLTDRGEAGIAAVRAAMADQKPFALAFIDMKMSGIDGAVTAKEIWQLDPDIKIVIVTAFSEYSPDDIVAIVGRDDLFYLNKPFNQGEIKQFSRALMEQWNLASEREKLRLELEKSNLNLNNLTQVLEDKVREQWQLQAELEENNRELEEQILHRKQVQQDLIKSEWHYRKLIENISDIITIVDQRGVISYTSPSVYNILGVAPESVTGRNLRDFGHLGDLPDFNIESLYQRYAGGEPFEYRVTTGDGELRILESIIHKFQEDDKTDRFILSSRDVTVRKKIEDEARKLQMVIEQTPSSVVVTDTQGTIEYVNPAFEQTTGYSSAEAIGLNPRVLKSGETPELVFKQLWSTITKGKIWRGEFINKKKNGEFYDENVLVVPIKNSKDEITNFVAVKENITELKRARKQAESANQAKSTFLSRMSHELRTPLNAINGFSQLMLKSKKNPLNDKQKNMTEQIYGAGNHLLQLINEILDLSRIESGEFSLAFESIDPQVVLDDCLALTMPLAQKQSITIENRCAKKRLPCLKTDFTRFKQVMLNLLSNAVKYNKPYGSVIIDAKTDIPELLRFVIEDKGLGIPESKQKDIFTPFMRAVENPDEIEGTGIGMTITKQLLEKMGGDIGFESRLGEGTTFWFTLPIAGAADEVSVPEEPDNSAKLENREEPFLTAAATKLKKVLYIEDNPLNRLFMKEAFTEFGEKYQLTLAENGELGVIAVKKEHPDLILMDLNLPGIDGFQACRQIKADPETEFIPIIAISADAMEKTIKRAHRMGFSGYISKPIDVSQLRKIMTENLEI